MWYWSSCTDVVICRRYCRWCVMCFCQLIFSSIINHCSVLSLSHCRLQLTELNAAIKLLRANAQPSAVRAQYFWSWLIYCYTLKLAQICKDTRGKRKTLRAWLNQDLAMILFNSVILRHWAIKIVVSYIYSVTCTVYNTVVTLTGGHPRIRNK